MTLPIYVFDPTLDDALSRVRGIGRYIHILKEILPAGTSFVGRTADIPKDSLFINPFFDPIKSPLVMRRIAKKQVAILHDVIRLKYPAHFPLGIKGNLNVFLNKLALNNYDLLIVNSQTTKNDVVSTFRRDANSVGVSYPAIDESLLSEFKDDTTVLQTLHITDKKYVIYVGDATWNKNLVSMARAVKQANVTCVVVGKVFKTTPGDHPEERELVQFLKEIDGDPRFILTGFVNDTHLKILYKHAACNLLLSRDEGFGFSFIEAGSQKTPSVLSNIPIFHEIAGISAFFVAHDHPDNIAVTLTKVMNDALYRESMGEKAYARVQQFTLEVSKKSFLKAIELVR